jgi:hypothetical protein
MPLTVHSDCGRKVSATEEPYCSIRIVCRAVLTGRVLTWFPVMPIVAITLAIAVLW